MRQGTEPALPTSTDATVVQIAREDRRNYDTRAAGEAGKASGVDAPIAVLVEADRDDVLANLQEAEATLRAAFPELVLVLNAVAGGEVLIGDVALAMGRLSSATRTVEDRVAAGPPHPDAPSR